MAEAKPGLDKIPSAHEVEEFHRNADTNKRPEAIHHTLGKLPNNASPGAHRHDGRDSVSLLDGLTITGSRSTNTAFVVQQILAALTQLGLQDGTSA